MSTEQQTSSEKVALREATAQRLMDSYGILDNGREDVELWVDAVLDALGLEQVGFWHDEYGFEGVKHGLAGPLNSGDPVYRLRPLGRKDTP